MKQPLPLALRTVMDGRLTMRQAHSLWAYAAYGVSPADDAESQARAMNYCRRDLSPWLFSGPLNDPDNAWIDFQAFVGLAAMHHVDLGIDLIHASSADMAAAFRQAYAAPPSAPQAPVVALEGPEKTRDKPGRAALQDAAALVNELVRNGTHATYDSAAWEAEARYKEYRLKQGTILREARRLREI